jgi:hypothetical protein
MPASSICACGAEVRAGWQFCPSCGRTTPKTCKRCNNALEATWKVCPFCGEPSAATASTPISTPVLELTPLEPVRGTPPTPGVVTTPAGTPSGPVWDARELSWSLADSLLREFVKPINPLFTALTKPFDSLAKLLAARDPALFVHACSAGLAAVGQQRISSTWPAPVRTALAGLDAHRKELLALLDPTVELIRSTSRDVAALNLPEGFWAQLAHGAGQAATPSTGAGMGALGGATIGSFIMPGIGTAIGGALGAIFGGSSSEKKNQAILEKYDQAFAQLPGAILELWNHVWDRVAEASQNLGCPLPVHTHYVEAETEWESLRQRETAGYPDVADYLERWGPMPDALRALFVGCLFCNLGGGVDEARALASRQRQLFPTRPDTLESQADLALHAGQWVDAVKQADLGLRLDAEHHRLKRLRIEALAALGRTSEAESSIKVAPEVPEQESPWVAYVRGSYRGRDVNAAVAAIQAWLAANAGAAAVARCLRQDAYLAPHFADLAGRVPALQPFTQGIDAECAAIVVSILPADGNKSHHGNLPVEKWANVQSHILKGERGKLLYFYDWSFWNDGKIGLALTPMYVIWRCLWSEPIHIPLRGLKPTEVRAEGTHLHVGAQSVDLEDATLALLLDAAISELCVAVNR